MNGPVSPPPATASHLLAEGNKLSSAGDRRGAIDLFKAALELEPSNSVTANEIGVAYYHLGDIPSAQQFFQKAVDIKPDFVRALTNLGACFNEQKDNVNAVKCYRRALELQPNMVDAWGNLAKAWTEAEEHELAVYAYQKVISLNPKGEFYRGLAKAYRKSGRYNRSEEALKVALDKNPQDHDAHFGLAYTHFHLEQYSEAVQEFEWRWQTKDLVKHKQDLYPIFNTTAYDGSQDLSGKTLLLHTEQGFGDNLQFARFIDLVRPKVQRLVMWTRPGLARLFKHSFDIEDISENVFKLPEFDYHLPLLSIPYYFDKNLSTLWNFTPYLSAPQSDGAAIERSADNLHIGIVWGASDTGFDHANKRVPLELLRPLTELPGTRWYSLQVGTDRKDLQAFIGSPTLIDLGDRLKDFADTASIVEQMDLIISVDTSVAHLAGAMGKPVWVMLKKNPDWRWHADGPETLWYPSARLFRQDSFGDWSSVIRRVSRALTQLASA